jgi:hypothetical protein
VPGWPVPAGRGGGNGGSGGDGCVCVCVCVCVCMCVSSHSPCVHPRTQTALTQVGEANSGLGRAPVVIMRARRAWGRKPRLDQDRPHAVGRVAAGATGTRVSCMRVCVRACAVCVHVPCACLLHLTSPPIYHDPLVEVARTPRRRRRVVSHHDQPQRLPPVAQLLRQPRALWIYPARSSRLGQPPFLLRRGGRRPVGVWRGMRGAPPGRRALLGAAA